MTCGALRDISNDLVRKDVFAIVDCEVENRTNSNPRLSLPFGKELLYTIGSTILKSALK